MSIDTPAPGKGRRGRKPKVLVPPEPTLEAPSQASTLEEALQEANNYVIPPREAAEAVYRLLFQHILPSFRVQDRGRSFSYRCTVDAFSFGPDNAELTVHFVTPYGDQYNADDLWLCAATQQESSAILVLGDGYTAALEDYIRYTRFTLLRRAPLDSSGADGVRLGVQMIPMEQDAVRLLDQAVCAGKAVICGAVRDLPGTSGKAKLQALFAALLETAYSKLPMILTPARSEEAIEDILQGTEPLSLFAMGGEEDNPEAKAELQNWLEGQFAAGVHPSLQELHGKFCHIPYGWQPMDIGALLARLLTDQKITVLSNGGEVSLSEPNLPAMLCGKGTEILSFAPRQELDPELLAECGSFLRRWLDTRDIPEDADDLVSLLRSTLRQREEDLQRLLYQYPTGAPYPGKPAVQAARDRVSDLLRRRAEQESFLREVAEQQGDLLRDAQATAAVSDFFAHQRSLFDSALSRTQQMQQEKSFFATDPEALNALRTASDILALPEPYSRLSELPDLLALLQAKYDAQCQLRRQEAKELIRHSLEDIRQLAEEGRDTEAVSRNAEVFFRRMGTDVRTADTLTRLDELIARIADKKNLVCRQLEALGHNLPPVPTGGKVRTVRRYDLCSSARLSSKEEIGAYVAQIRAALEQALEGADGIQVL